MGKGDEDVWRCGCGENDFMLLRNGTVVCAVCDKISIGVKVLFGQADKRPSKAQRPG